MKTCPTCGQRMKLPPGRPVTTGRYDTREELEQHVWLFWNKTGATMEWVAKMTGVSSSTVNNILNRERPSGA